MVTFTERIVGNDRYLRIFDAALNDSTELIVHTPLFKGHAKEWKQLSRADYGSSAWTVVKTFGRNEDIVRHLLLSTHHTMTTEVIPSQMLKNRIVSNEATWGDNLILEGEFQYTSGYWEWVEDILCRSRKTLITAEIYDAVYASLYTYDRVSDIVRAFCESWSPTTNTLFTSIGETSISLWDIHRLGGLPILGGLFDEVIPSASELTDGGHGKQRSLPRTCSYLFHAFHLLQRKSTRLASIGDWIRFWCKIHLHYKAPPPRKEQKSKRSNLTHNPTGVLPGARSWSSKDRKPFTDLNVREDLMEETYLAAFISCWICVFVLPRKPLGYIRPEVFKMACFMAKGHKVSLAVPVLSSIYRGLNLIAKSKNPNDAKTCFPAHYVYSWIASYFSTHYTTPSDLEGPLMVKYSGEGGARYYNENAAYKRFQINPVNWSCNKLESKTRYFTDDGMDKSTHDTSYFLSLRTNFLPRRVDGDFRLEPYNPHRFSRQFGFCQDTPGVAIEDYRRVSLDAGLRFFRLCTLTGSNQTATFPLHDTKYCFTKSYETWLKGAYAKDSRQKAIPSPPATVDVSHEYDPARPQIRMPSHGIGKQLHLFKNRANPTLSPHECSRTSEATPQVSRSGKRKEICEEDEADSVSDRNFKHVRTKVTVSLPELPSEGNSFLCPTTETLGGDRQLNSKDLEILGSLVDDVADVGGQGEVEQPSVFEGVQFVSKVAQTVIENTWKALCDKLRGKSSEDILSMQHQVGHALEEMKYISKSKLFMLEDTLNSFFQSAQSVHDAQLQFSDSQTLSSSTSRLARVKLQIGEKSKHIEEVIEEIRQTDAKEVELKRQLEDLANGKQDLATLLHQDKEDLKSLQIEVPILEERICLLKEAVPPSKDDEERYQQMLKDLDAQKQGLCDFKITF